MVSVTLCYQSAKEGFVVSVTLCYQSAKEGFVVSVTLCYQSAKEGSVVSVTLRLYATRALKRILWCRSPYDPMLPER